jgi:hypothetical protein
MCVLLPRYEHNRLSLRAPRLCESYKRLQDGLDLISRRDAGNAEIFCFRYPEHFACLAPLRKSISCLQGIYRVQREDVLIPRLPERNVKRGILRAFRNIDTRMRAEPPCDEIPEAEAFRIYLVIG